LEEKLHKAMGGLTMHSQLIMHLIEEDLGKEGVLPRSQEQLSLCPLKFKTKRLMRESILLSQEILEVRFKKLQKKVIKISSSLMEQKLEIVLIFLKGQKYSLLQVHTKT
jgi:hypothetical protein